MLVKIRDHDGFGYTTVNTGDREVEAEAVCGLAIITAEGRFEIYQANGGIEVYRDGELSWSSTNWLHGRKCEQRNKSD